MISSHYQQPELGANQTELFCSESTSRQLTKDCFLHVKTNTNSAQSDFISYPFCHSFHWLAPVHSTRTSFLSIPPSFISVAVFPCCSSFVHSTQFVLFAVMKSGVPVATGTLSACMYVRACACVCVVFQGRAVQAAVWSILMFIDRKINGALIQDLALREGGRMQVWRLVEEQQRERKRWRKNRRGRKGLGRWGRVKRKQGERKKFLPQQASVCLHLTDMRLEPLWLLLGVGNYMCEQPVVA